MLFSSIELSMNNYYNLTTNKPAIWPLTVERLNGWLIRYLTNEIKIFLAYQRKIWLNLSSRYPMRHLPNETSLKLVSTYVLLKGKITKEL